MQNTADYRDLGVATSGVTFLRTLGSSFGAAVFGAVYSNALDNTLPDAVVASGVNPSVIATPKALHSLPATQIAPIVDAYAHVIHVVFLAAVPVALVAFVLSLFLKEAPLRGTSRAGSSDVGEAFGMPEGADSAQQLQIAIARLFRKQGRQALPAIREASGTTLDAADGWCVAQVHVRRHLGADSSVAAISRRFHVPAPVLAPAFHAARDNGYLTGGDDRLELTQQGDEEIHKVIAGTRAWLASELIDWGADDDELLSEALTTMATQFVDEDADRRLEPAPAS